MPTRTTNLQLYKPAGTEVPDIDLNNGNMDTLDTEITARAKSVNGTTVDASGNIPLPVVPYAENLQTSQSQSSSEDFIFRPTGGDASVEDGDAWLTIVKGEMVHTGYTAKSVAMTPTLQDGSDITATIDEDTFLAAESSDSGTETFTYTTAWDTDPANYGITVTGTPVNGDVLTVVYQKEVRGTITMSNPEKLISTGWNLYNHSVGYAKVKKYSAEYGFMIAGTYSALSFSTTLEGTQTVITPVDGYFSVPDDGYVFVTGGNNTNTQIWMTWNDWTTAALANGGTWQAYSQTVVDLSDVMDTYFPNGLMRVGSYQDEINMNVGKATSNVQRLVYSAANLEVAIATGRDYEYDEDYIYVGRASGIVYDIELEGDYSASDHGEEYFTQTTVPVYAQTLYGANLKNKLERDVLTISQQTLTSGQKTQVLTNIGAAPASLSDQIASQVSCENFGTYSSWTDIRSAIATKAASLQSGDVRPIRFYASPAFDVFKNAIYTGDLYVNYNDGSRCDFNITFYSALGDSVMLSRSNGTWSYNNDLSANTAVSNANSTMNSGVYTITSASTNTPTASGLLFHMKGRTYTFQFAIAQNHMYYRLHNGTAWQSWYECTSSVVT